MNLLSNFFKKKNNSSYEMIDVFSPLSGTIVNIEDVPDEVFSKKIVGDGVAILPESNIILSPVNGTIGKIFETLHAFSIKTNNNIELFVHFGIDTVKLKGLGFKNISKKNKTVKIGDPIISIDLPFVMQKTKSILTPVIMSNMEQCKKMIKNSGKVIAGKTIIFSIKK